MEPDNDLSDTDWKEVLLTIIDTNDSSMHPDALHQAIMDHSYKESDDAADLIRNAADENYLFHAMTPYCLNRPKQTYQGFRPFRESTD